MRKVIMYSFIMFLVFNTGFADDGDRRPDEDRKRMEDDRGREMDRPEKGERPHHEEVRERLENTLEQYTHQIHWIEDELNETFEEVRPFLERMLDIRKNQLGLVEKGLDNLEHVVEEKEGMIFDELIMLDNEYRLAETEYNWKREVAKLVSHMEELDHEAQKEIKQIIKELDKQYKKKITLMEKMNTLHTQTIEIEESLRMTRERIDGIFGEEHNEE